VENDVFALVQAGIAVELLVPVDNPAVTEVGIRLRTYGKQLPPNKMVLGVGEVFQEALLDAMQKAKSGRWENLDWSARPWAKGRPLADGGAAWGLV
jgi:hypothetical protein